AARRSVRARSTQAAVDELRRRRRRFALGQGADPGDYSKRYQAGCDSTAGIARPDFFLSSPIGNLAGGFNANVFPGIDFPAYIDYLNGRYGGMQSRREPDFVYDVDEQSTGGYFQANFRTQRLRGNFGVRVVKTK
ncbi:hypothetical protein AB4084_30290, partial [Lysobacter sp. 2RAB21]